MKDLRTALEEVDGCFQAAMVEGLRDAIGNRDVDRLIDLIERRLMFAHHAAIAALAQSDDGNGLTIHRGTDGTWLSFNASGGESEVVHVETMAQRLGSPAMRKWCEDRAKEPGS